MSIAYREALESSVPYVPARTVRSLKEELHVDKIIKLAGNENNLGSSPSIIDALLNYRDEYSRYPDFANTELLIRLTKALNVKDDQLIFGNGSFELITIIANTYLNAGDESIYAEPSFGWYKNVTLQAGAIPVAVPVNNDHAVDLDKILQAITGRTKIIWICNPNNPTGTALNQKELTSFLSKVPDHILVVLDEAYIDFYAGSDRPDTTALIQKYDNLISLRTFSKLYGLASLRLGYGISNPTIIRDLHRVKTPGNVNAAAQVAGAAALDDHEFTAKVLENNRSGLALYYDTLEDLGLEYIPSNGNFIMINTGLDSDQVVSEYLKHGILLRGGNEFGMPGWLRITIGTEEENKLVLEILKEIIKTGPK